MKYSPADLTKFCVFYMRDKPQYVADELLPELQKYGQEAMDAFMKNPDVVRAVRVALSQNFHQEADLKDYEAMRKIAAVFDVDIENEDALEKFVGTVTDEDRMDNDDSINRIPPR